LALERERAFIFAGITGVMQWQLKQVIIHARSRTIGEQKLGHQQAISHKIADIKTRIDTTKLWLAHCANLLDVGKRITVQSAQTKLYASEAFLQTSLDTVHIFGAAGLTAELTNLVEDAMAGRLMAGSSELQRNIIATMLGLDAR
jgi:alkylation response protein AidB-like acyl-CoA dehydrogenase